MEKCNGTKSGSGSDNAAETSAQTFALWESSAEICGKFAIRCKLLRCNPRDRPHGNPSRRKVSILTGITRLFNISTFLFQVQIEPIRDLSLGCEAAVPGKAPRGSRLVGDCSWQLHDFTTQWCHRHTSLAGLRTAGKGFHWPEYVQCQL